MKTDTLQKQYFELLDQKKLLNKFTKLFNWKFRKWGISDAIALQIWGVTNRTAQRWLEGNKPIHPWMINSLRDYIKSRFEEYFSPFNFEPYEESNNHYYIRIKSSLNTHVNTDTLLTLIYQHLNKIEKIVLFPSYIKEKNRGNNRSFGFLMQCKGHKQYYYLQDKSGMTAERNPRELEIIKIFNHLILNELESKIFLLNKELDNKLEKESVAIITDEVMSNKLLPLDLNNLVPFLEILRDCKGYLDPSRYLLDAGISTLEYLLQIIKYKKKIVNSDLSEILLTPEDNITSDEFIEQTKNTFISHIYSCKMSKLPDNYLDVTYDMLKVRFYFIKKEGGLLIKREKQKGK